MVFDRFFGRSEEAAGDDQFSDRAADEVSDETLPVLASSTETRTDRQNADSDSPTHQQTTLKERYDIDGRDTIRVGGKPVITETTDEGTVAGPFVREMFEAGMHSTPSPLWIGYTEDPQSGFREAPLRFESLFRHTWIAGTTGYGKTTELLNMMVQWAYAGYGFTYFDPKGRDSRELLRMLPEHRLEDVVWIEPGSTTHEKTIGLNFLEVPECGTTEELENEIENRVENLKAVFDTSDYWGINMEAITESMARAMMKSDKPFSVIDMYFTLLNAERREDFALDVEDPYLQEFCLEIAKMEDETVRPLLKRIKSWVENSVIRRIIAHRESTIDFREIIDNDRIVIVRTPVENTDIKKMVTLGVMRNLWSAIQRRSYELDATPDPYFVLCDEFDDIASENLDIESMLARARSMRLSVTLASQYPSQFDEDTLKAMQNNCDNLLTFSVNDSDDAELLMKRFRDYTAEDLITTDQFKVWTRIPLSGGRYSEPVLVRTFPPYPPLRGTDEVDEIIERSLERYGTDPLTDSEILRNLIYREYNEAASPDALTADRTMAEAIRAVQLREDVREENGWISVAAVDEEVIARLEDDESPDDTVTREEFPDVRQESPLIDVDISVHEDTVVVRLTDEGEAVAEPETGTVRSAGGAEHDALLLDLEAILTKHDFHVNILEQDGSNQPDGTATHPEFDAVFALEAETTTPDRPAKVLKNLKRAQETDRIPLFVVRPGEDDQTRIAARLENILEPPIREMADGSEQFYNTDDLVTFGSGADSHGGVTAVRPATESQRTVWTRRDSQRVLSDGDREFVRTSLSVDLSKDSVPAYYSYDRETGQYTVYQHGETHVYESSDAFSADWTTINRPFVPSRELPNPEFDRDSYTVLILPDDGTAQFYRQGKTMALSDALESLVEARESSRQRTENETVSAANDSADSAESDLPVDPDTDGVDAFVDRYLVPDDDGAIPKDDLYQAYSTWVTEHGLDGTNDVWFARKLSTHLEVGTERRRVNGERVNLHTGISLTADGERLLEEAGESE